MLDADIQDQPPPAIKDRAPTKAEDATHGAAECRSLRCPLHQWSCDLNGNLVLATESA